MKRIPLTRGQFALVDDDDFDEVNQFKWVVVPARKEGMFYAMASIRKNKKLIYLHKMILNSNESLMVDHINHNTLDNRKANLRFCTPAQNQMNQLNRKNTTSKYKGVCWDKRYKKWMSYIQPNGKFVSLGYFKKEKRAAVAYNESAKKYFGEFAYVNKI